MSFVIVAAVCAALAALLYWREPRWLPPQCPARVIIAWARAFLVTIAAAILVVIAHTHVSSLLQRDDEFFWSAALLDRSVVWGGFTIIFFTITVTIVNFAHQSSTILKQIRRFSYRVAATVFVIIGLFITYASFRNQTRLSAETALNEEAMQLYQIEMKEKHLRCIYDNYAPEDRNSCLKTLISTDGEWSMAIFYVEEAWFILKKAKDDADIWGSTYAESIGYWANDVSKDETGLFSYYLISNEESVAKAKARMNCTDVCIPDLCMKYENVVSALSNNNKENKVNYCDSNDARAAGKSDCKMRLPYQSEICQKTDR
jgi:hypothetical protein